MSIIKKEQEGNEMEQPKDAQCRKAYIMGYRDGVRDAQSGKDLANIDSDLLKLPVEAMEITSRACNCLLWANCYTIGEVLRLDTDDIRRIRNMGPTTAKQIALWLTSHGFYCSAWSEYL